MITNILLASLLACDPELTPLFTPLHPQLGRYEVCVDAASLDEAGAAARRDGFHLAPVEELEPLDAFGASGTYDRSALVRLYGGGRVKVIRGWRQNADAFESVTLISPYPDVSMTRLETGTLLIRWKLA
jgi:hypothetical protein